ncbi:MAG: hypothetical protein VX113_02235 [Pseudomonadota bacterium]|nr:hypothetical protein [Pseudomonadota bacterium]
MLAVYSVPVGTVIMAQINTLPFIKGKFTTRRTLEDGQAAGAGYRDA